MVYVLIFAVSALGILFLFLTRGLLRGRNARRIVRSFTRRFSSLYGEQGRTMQEHGAKWLPDTFIVKPFDPLTLRPFDPSTLRRSSGQAPLRAGSAHGGERKPPRAKAIELQQVRTLLGQAQKAFAKRDAHAAELSLIRALTIQPHAKEVKAFLAMIYLESERVPKAEILYRELLEDTRDPALFANLGLSCYKQERFAEACEAYAKALELDPGNPDRSFALGRACIAAGRFKDAIPLLERAATSLPKNLDLLHLLAQCHLQTGESAKAEETYRRINRLDPRDEGVKAKIAELAR